MWEVEYTDEFEVWWDNLQEDEQVDIAASVGLLEKFGPRLTFPHSSGVKNSQFSHMRELRVQHAGNPYRVLYVFDPRRCALLLIGGNKTGDKRWYETHIPIADKLYEKHLAEIKSKGVSDE